jgi:hypothetical protein
VPDELVRRTSAESILDWMEDRGWLHDLTGEHYFFGQLTVSADYLVGLFREHPAETVAGAICGLEQLSSEYDRRN